MQNNAFCKWCKTADKGDNITCTRCSDYEEEKRKRYEENFKRDHKKIEVWVLK